MSDSLAAATARPLDIPLVDRLEVEHICDFSIRFDPMQAFATSRGRRAIYVIQSGVVSGPRLNGAFLPGGGDWVTIDEDGVAALDVRATIRADDGEMIYVTNTGRVRLDDAARAKMMTGAMLRWDEIRARSSPLFETGAPKYRWLNSVVTIAINEFSVTGVNYRIYEVK